MTRDTAASRRLAADPHRGGPGIDTGAGVALRRTCRAAAASCWWRSALWRASRAFRPAHGAHRNRATFARRTDPRHRAIRAAFRRRKRCTRPTVRALRDAATQALPAYDRLSSGERVAAVAKASGISAEELGPAHQLFRAAQLTRTAQCHRGARNRQTSSPKNKRQNMETESSTIQKAAELLGKLRAGIGEAVVGQPRVIEEVVLALVASGHVLIEGVPGLGKTLLVRALAQALQLSYGPRAVHARHDALGHHRPRGARSEDHGDARRARPGVHAPAARRRDQSRARQDAERVARGDAGIPGHARGPDAPLPKPFMVLATQNPVETEGTYPLPEAQLDRFLFKIEIGYPDARGRSGRGHPRHHRPGRRPVAAVEGRRRCSTSARSPACSSIAARQRVDEQVIDYAVRLARATREWAGHRAGRRIARRARAGARRPRRGVARRPQLRDPR